MPLIVQHMAPTSESDVRRYFRLVSSVLYNKVVQLSILDDSEPFAFSENCSLTQNSPFADTVDRCIEGRRLIYSPSRSNKVARFAFSDRNNLFIQFRLPNVHYDSWNDIADNNRWKQLPACAGMEIDELGIAARN